VLEGAVLPVVCLGTLAHLIVEFGVDKDLAVGVLQLLLLVMVNMVGMPFLRIQIRHQQT